MITSDEVTRWQMASVTLWHQQPVSLQSLSQLGWGKPEPLLQRVMVNHELNFRLWHEEDLARDPSSSDAVIAAVKRRIDVLNQQRNDAIEAIDQQLAKELAERAVAPLPDAGFNTETPGAAIDRLSILALRLYHLQEQCAPVNPGSAVPVTAAAGKAAACLPICRQQQARLAEALDQLLADICCGSKRHELFHQFKMYNDPAFNPLLAGQPTPGGGDAD